MLPLLLHILLSSVIIGGSTAARGSPAGAAPAAAATVGTGTPVFIPGTFGARTYRIPALARTPGGTLIAVAEARTGGDCDKKWLVTRRSLDNGTTWLPQEDVWGRDLPDSLFASNPTIGFHPATGAVVLTFISASAAQCSPGIDSWVAVDGGSAGARWGAPVNISAALGAWRGA